MSESGSKINVGEIVRLKSGGPLMTVAIVDVGKNSVTCVWFSEPNQKFNSDTFATDVLARESVT